MSRYHKGRRFEYKVRDLLKREGWIVFRCAASKPVDLIALKGDAVVLIECKTGKARLTKDQKRFLRLVAERTKAIVVIAEQEDGQVLFKVLK